MNKKQPLPSIKAHDIKALPFEQLVSEVEQRVTRLRACQQFSTRDTSEDIVFLDNAARWGNNPQERDDLGKKMTELGIPELFQHVWRTHSKKDYFDRTSDPLWDNMCRVMVVMWNMTDKCTALCQRSLDIGVHKDTLHFMKQITSEATTNPRQSRVVKGFMGILHNLLHRIHEARQPIRDEDAVNIIQKFRSSAEPMVACKALILQAYLITEQENEALNSDEQTFSFLHTLLVSALRGEEHRSAAYGFHAEETLVAVNKLAANDNNKQRIVAAGFLPEYVRLLQDDCSVDEHIAAAQGLWALAFKCRDDVRSQPGCLEALQKLADTSPNETVRNVAKGALWQLKDEQVPQQPTTQTQIETSSKRSGGKVPAGSRHIMISYQWDSKPTILLIRDRLKAAGFNIWVDVDNMYGSVLEAMAEAVEKAGVVLVCLTQNYKESPNCRAEAEYTFRLHKQIIPLRIEQKYYPDGWLGLLCGNNLVYDFSQTFKYEDSFNGLMKSLGKYGVGGDTSGDVASDQVDSKETIEARNVPRLTHQRTVDISNWTTDNVAQWIKNSDLQHLIKWFSNYDGPLLIELIALKREAPESLYTLLRDNKFTLTDILKLNRALKQLSY